MSFYRWAVVAAGGTGSRFGGPKQFAELGGRTLVEIAVNLFTGAGWDGVVSVLPEGAPPPGDAVFALAGSTRRQSVASGLAKVPIEADLIAVHDAARPLATPALVDALEARLVAADGAIPGRPVVDTLKRVGPDGLAFETLPRERLRSVQTPQLFKPTALRRAHEVVPPEVPAPDDAALLEHLGYRVVVVDWLDENPKVTHPRDLERLRLGL